MRIIIWIVGAMMLAAPPPEVVTKARESATGLSQELRRLLMDRMKAQGVAGAVTFCSKEAQEVTRDFGKRQGVQIKRVSARNRNAANRADARDREQLEAWERQKAAGEELVEGVTEEGGALVYRRPILIEGGCLSCHGQAKQLAGPVRAAIRARYPEDRATGYRAGELRGAVVVTIPLQP